MNPFAQDECSIYNSPCICKCHVNENQRAQWNYKTVASDQSELETSVFFSLFVEICLSFLKFNSLLFSFLFFFALPSHLETLSLIAPMLS